VNSDVPFLSHSLLFFAYCIVGKYALLDEASVLRPFNCPFMDQLVLVEQQQRKKYLIDGKITFSMNFNNKHKFQHDVQLHQQ